MLRFFTTILLLTLILFQAPAYACGGHEFDDVSIVIPTFDKYSELWHPTTTLLYRQWPTLLTTHKHVPIYLISNEETFGDPRITNLTVGQENKTLASLLQGLKQIKTTYVILILDDYLMTKPVNLERLNEVINLAKRDDTGYIELDGDVDREDAPHVPGIEGVTVKALDSKYRLNTQAGLWKRDVLMSFIDPNEHNRDFEIQGSIRSRQVKNPFYQLSKNPVFTYLNAANEGRYIKSAIDYVNAQGIPFAPVKMPIRQKCDKWDVFCGACKKFNVFCSLSSGKNIENDRGETPH